MAKRSLLLVDADARSARVLEVSLKKAGFTVTTASSAAEALQSALKSAPDLLLTETALPDSDGFALCFRIKADARTAETGVIFLSLDARPETRVKAINAGADDFLAKPVLVMEVVSRLKSLLEKREASAIARRDRPGNLSGTLAHMGVVDILQLMEAGQKSGIAHLASDPVRSGGLAAGGEQRGTIYFREGRVIDAAVARLSGAAAIYRMLLWEDGVFEIEFKTISRDDQVKTSPQALLLEGMRRVDEWSRLSAKLPPLTSRLAVDMPALAQRPALAPEAMRPVLHLFDGKRTILEVVNEAAADDVAVLELAQRLIEQGVLYAGERPSTAPPAPEVQQVEAWLSTPGVGPRLVEAVKADDTLNSLPSVLGRAVIPSNETPSEILGRGQPPVPLTQPVRERTPVPEPLPEDSAILSRHTVPTPEVVLLTEPSKGQEPIPLTQARSVPKLTIQRMPSVVASNPSRPATRDLPGPSTRDLPSTGPATAADAGWSPVTIGSEPRAPANVALASADNERTLTDLPIARPSAPAAPAVAVSTPPAPAVPLDETEPVGRRRAGSTMERAPVRSPSLIVAPAALPPWTTPPAPAPASAGTHPPASSASGASWPAQTLPPAARAVASSAGAPPAVIRPPTQETMPVPLAAQAAIRAAEALTTAPSEGPTLPSLPPIAPASLRPSGNGEADTLRPAQRPAITQPLALTADSASTLLSAPPPAELPGAQRLERLAGGRVQSETSTSGLHDAFFDRSSGSSDEIQWEPVSRWRRLAPLALVVVVIAGVFLVMRPGAKKEPPPAAKVAPPPPTKKPSAQWPAAPEAEIQVSGNTAATATAALRPPEPAAAPAPEAPKPVAPAPGPAANKPMEAAKPVEARPVEPAKPVEVRPVEVARPAELAKPAAGDTSRALAAAEAALKGDRLKEAERQFRAAIAADASNAQAHSGLAMALYGLERDGPALAAAKKALSLDGNSARGHLVTGLIASDRQDIGAAKKAIQRYLELAPDGEYAAELRRFLASQK